MRYQIDYQYMGKGALRPSDDGEVVGISATDESGVVLLPNVGDFVHIDNSADGGERVSFSGKVRSRAFFYIRSVDDVFCNVNIVIEETDDKVWAQLIKE
jgi:hypothetical protein